MDQIWLDWFLLFSIYALFGWVIETVFKSTAAGKFVNSGFLTGPFCPIYGFGALLVIQSSALAARIFPQAHNSYLQIIISLSLAICFTTLLEYVTGALMETLFDSKWWDYSQERFNLQGRVCLKYSLFWGILSWVMLALIHPHLAAGLHALPAAIRHSLVYGLLVYFAVDLTRSTSDAYALRSYLRLYLSQHHLDELLQRHKRLLGAFPQISLNMMKKPYQEVRSALHHEWAKLDRTAEFRRCIDDLLTHESIQEMKLYRHHSSVSCFEHSMNVAYLSFRVCRTIGWDYTAAARGGLLHDLFLYDWRTYKPQEGLHGFVHPRLALRNAQEVCALSKVERDIILKHMFPLTWSPPRYKESLVVCLVDTLCSLWEIVYSRQSGKRFPEPTTVIINDI